MCDQFLESYSLTKQAILCILIKYLTLWVCVLMINRGGTRTLGSAHMIFHVKIIFTPVLSLIIHKIIKEKQAFFLAHQISTPIASRTTPLYKTTGYKD